MDESRLARIVILLFIMLAILVPGCGSEEVEQGELPTASGGTETALVPDVVGKSQREAEQALRLAGFEVEEQRREGAEGESGEVVEQSPSGGGEAEEGVAVVIVVVVQAPPPPPPEEEPPPSPEEASGSAPGYNLIQDPTGALTLEVPPSWGVETGADSEDAPSWSSVAGYLITSSITTATSLDAWYSNQPTVGAYIVASRELAEAYTDDDLLYSGPSADEVENCDTGSYEDFDRPPYSGKMQTWFNCGEIAQTKYMVAAAPEGRECVVLLDLSVPNEEVASEAEREAVRHILDTFEVDCAGIAAISTEEGRTAEFAAAGSRPAL